MPFFMSLNKIESTCLWTNVRNNWPHCKISNSMPLRQWLFEQLFQQSLREQLFQQWLWEQTFFGNCSNNPCWNSCLNNHCGNYCSNNDCGNKNFFDCCSKQLCLKLLFLQMLLEQQFILIPPKKIVNIIQKAFCQSQPQLNLTQL